MDNYFVRKMLEEYLKSNGLDWKSFFNSKDVHLAWKPLEVQGGVAIPNLLGMWKNCKINYGKIVNYINEKL